MSNSVPIVRSSNNSGKGFLIFLIIVLLCTSLGLGGYIAYEKFFVKKEVIPVKETSEALEQVKIDGESLLQVEDIINAFEYAYNDPFSDYFGYIYKNNTLKVKDFDKQAALFACLYPYLDESINVSYVANNTVKNKFKSIFGPDVEYAPNNVSAGGGYDIKYDPTISYFSYQRLGVGGFFHPTYVTYNESSTVSSDKIQITKRVAYIEYTNDHTSITIYPDSKKGSALGMITVSEGSFSPTEIKAKYKSSLSQYQYTFVKKKNGFVFDSIIRTK